MDKSTALQRSAATGRFMTKPLGKAKAEKFAKVEGVTTSAVSAALLSTHIERGLQGDALRSAIRDSFVGKKGK
jgi:hypothetical protein